MNERRIRTMSRKLDEALDEEPPETPRTKKWFASRTIWLQIIGAVIAIVSVVSASPTFRPYAEGFAIAQSILTIVLRVITDTPIEGGPKDGG